METYIYERPSAPLTGLAPMSAARITPVADVPWRPQVHQVQAQLVELVQAGVSLGVNGTSGFTGMDIQLSSKRTDVRGVPPRGRPV